MDMEVDKGKTKQSFVEKLQNLEKLDPELVLSWLSMLTDLEQKVLSILYQQSKSLTIKMIRTILMENTLHNTLRNTQLYNVFIDDVEFPYPSFYDLDAEQKIKISTISEFEHELSLKRIQKVFTFPSFRSIDITIQRLIKLGVVNQRPESEITDKKVKGLYFLNPFLKMQLNKLKSKL